MENTLEMVSTFKHCTQLLTSDPILQFASIEYAIGAELSQGTQGTIGGDLIVVYANRTLNPSEVNFSIIERE